MYVVPPNVCVAPFDGLFGKLVAILYPFNAAVGAVKFEVYLANPSVIRKSEMYPGQYDAPSELFPNPIRVEDASAVAV